MFVAPGAGCSLVYFSNFYFADSFFFFLFFIFTIITITVKFSSLFIGIYWNIIYTIAYIKYGCKSTRPAKQRQPHYHYKFTTYSTTTA